MKQAVRAQAETTWKRCNKDKN